MYSLLYLSIFQILENEIKKITSFKLKISNKVSLSFAPEHILLIYILNTGENIYIETTIGEVKLKEYYCTGHNGQFPELSFNEIYIENQVFLTFLTHNEMLHFCYKNIGTIHFVLNNILRAIKYYKKAISCNKYIYNTYIEIASAFNFIFMYDEAIKYLEIGNTIFPYNYKFYILYGHIFSRKKDYDKAIKNCQISENMFDKDYRLYQLWAKTLYELEKYSEALEKIEKSLQLCKEKDETKELEKIKKKIEKNIT